MTQPPDVAAADWFLIVPVKRLAIAKTRLGGSAAAHRGQLALAFAHDTVAAAIRCPAVGGVLVVTDDPAARDMAMGLGATVVEDRDDAGLNPALRWGAEFLRELTPDIAIGALSADLPALRPAELEIALGMAGVAGRAGSPAVVADSHGRGTTAYLSAAGVEFSPAYGTDSLAAHVRGGAIEVVGVDIPSVRLDVDTISDLAAAVRLGVGERTRAALAERAVF